MFLVCSRSKGAGRGRQVNLRSGPVSSFRINFFSGADVKRGGETRRGSGC